MQTDLNKKVIITALMGMYCYCCFVQIIQTPGLWEKDGTTGGVTLTEAGSQVVSGCSGMCSLT